MGGLLIHIGYHKTGTTWLQQHLFINEEVGFGAIVAPSERAQFSQDFILKNALDFEVEVARKFFQDRIQQLESQNLFPVLSAERLSGAFQAGGYDSKLLAERLQACLPDGKILIVIREQRSMIYSAYVQYVRGGGPRNLKHYFRGPRRAKGFLPAFDPVHFEYDRLVKCYQALFGKEQVLVLPYEFFRKDAPAFVRTIVDFCGLEVSAEQLQSLPFTQQVNTGYSAATLAMKRWYNRGFVDSSLNHGVRLGLPEGSEKLFVKSVQRLEGILPRGMKKNWERQQKAFIAEQVHGRFEASNQRLQEMTGLDLGKYQYQL